MHNSIGLEDQVGSAAKVRPQLIERRAKIGLRCLDASSWRGQKRARGSRSKVAGRVSPVPRLHLFPDGHALAVVVSSNLNGGPVELLQRANQAAHQRRLARAPAAAAYDDNGHLPGSPLV